MPFCAPIWRLLFKGGQDAEKGASQRLDIGTATAGDKSKLSVGGKPVVLTKEEKLKEQRRKDVEQLRETLRRRRELLEGIVEVPLKNGTIEGYQIRVVRGPSEGAMTFPKPQHTKESMEKCSRFTDSKIKQREEETGKGCGGKICDLKKGKIHKEPVEDAVTKRLLQLQAERDVKKKEQSECADKRKANPTDESSSRKDHSENCPVETAKSRKDSHKEESHKSKEVHKDHLSTKRKSGDGGERANDKEINHGSPIISKERSMGGKSPEQNHDVAEHHIDKHQKTSKLEEGEGLGETPDDKKHSKVEDDGETHGEDREHDIDGVETHVEEHKKSIKEKKSKGKK